MLVGGDLASHRGIRHELRRRKFPRRRARRAEADSNGQRRRARIRTTAAVDALSFDRALALDGTGTVSVSGSVQPGSYTLLTATSLTGGGGLTLQMSDDRFNAKLAVVGNALVLHVNSPCTTVIIR